MSTDRLRPAPIEAWDAWRPTELACRLKRVSRRWYVVGGWALDLWHGFQTREHEDLEFSALSDDVAVFRELLGELAFFTAHAGVVEFLPKTAEPPTHVAQLWGLDTAAGYWRVDMMIERGTPSTWVYKRDPTIRAARSEAIRTDEKGIAYLAPAAVLLFKAKHRRPKDETDFERALPKLSLADRVILKQWLDIAHPGHAWRDAL